MKPAPALLVAPCIAALAAGCLGSDPRPGPQAGAAAAGAAADAARPLTPEAELKQALEAWSAAGLRGRPLIPHTKFTPLLPDRLAGLTGAEAQGKTEQRGAASQSEASREYTGPGKTLTIRIVDRPMTGAMERDALGLIAMSAEEDALHHTRPYLRGEYYGRLQLFKQEPRARAVLAVKRFRLEIDSHGFEGAHGVERALDGLDLQALAALLQRPGRPPAPGAAPAPTPTEPTPPAPAQPGKKS